MATKNKYAPVFAIVRHIQQFDREYDYRDAVSEFTNGRTKSLNDLSSAELSQFIAILGKKTGSGKQDYADDPRDKQRKAIIAIFKRKGKTVADAIAWAEKRGVKGEKKAFNAYNGQELYQLTTAAEKWV